MKRTEDAQDNVDSCNIPFLVTNTI